MINPDHIFKNALHNYETPLEGKATFEGVMQKRKNKRRGFFWFSLSSVLLLLLSLTAAAMLHKPAAGKMENTAVQKQFVQNNTLADARTTEKNSVSENYSTVAKDENQSNAVTSIKTVENRAGSSLAKGESLLGRRTQLKVDQTSTEQNIESIRQLVVQAENAVVQPNSSVNKEIEETVLREYAGWIKQITGRGIADEFMFRIIPTEGHVIPEFVPFYPPRKARFNPIFELNVATAGNGYKYFRESQDVTVAGNHRFSQYQGIMLFDLGRGVNLGSGLGYMESVGIAKALTSEWKIDSTSTPVRVTTAQNISYRLNKFSVPLAFRYQLGFGRSLVRISATAMPGIIAVGSGMMFSRNAIQLLDNLKKNTLSLDARLGAGLYYQVAPKTAISAEPMIQYQSIPGAQWKSFRHIGFGFGMGVVFRP